MDLELNFEDVVNSYNRIQKYVKNTSLISNQEINNEIKANIFFKCDNFQETRSFKARGAFNAILSYKEKNNKFPEKIVAVSSGNHAQAIAYACNVFKIKALIYMDKNVLKSKIDATKSWGAEVVLCENRAQANSESEEKIKEGYFFIHPSDNDDVILGQATACYEALISQGEEFDAIFAPVGGGGLIAGAYLAAQGLSKNAKIIGCEPAIANDAALSLRNNEIFSFDKSPQTIADGARTLAVSDRCFYYLKKISQIIEVSEEEIRYWHENFIAITKIKIEPTSALAIAGAKKYVEKNYSRELKKILVIISGANS